MAVGAGGGRKGQGGGLGVWEVVCGEGREKVFGEVSEEEEGLGERFEERERER